MPRVVTLLAILALLAAGCADPSLPPSSPASESSTPSGHSPAPSAPTSPSGPSRTTRAPEPTATGSPIPDTLRHMALREKIGQILMVGVPVTGDWETSAQAITRYRVANVFLHGRTQAGRDVVADLVTSVRKTGAAANPRDPLMLIATDQEGGAVQVLQGPGFSTIPSAVDQARLSPDTLHRRATTWGRELADVGVNLNLAPVADVVPEQKAASNAPIGAVARNYGFSPQAVIDGSVAFGRGMREAGVETTPKHFPGLGRVSENTDATTGVTDTMTGPDADSVAAFRANVEAGTGFVMMSSAVYAKIDPDRPAVFSPKAIRLLREDLGFEGVVVTDDLSAAAQVQPWPAGRRAVLAVEAGCDLVLASADPTTTAPMADALAQRAQEDEDFARRIDEAATRVLAAKADLRG